MNAIIPLSHCLSAPYPEDHLISREPDTTWRAFLAQVAGLCDQLPTQSEKPILLAIDNPTTFAAALFACLHQGLTAVSSTDLQPGTVVDLLPAVGAVVTDRTDFVADIPIIYPRSSDKIPEFGVLSPQQTALYLFTSGSSGSRKMIEKTLGQLEAEITTLQQLWGDAAGRRLRLATVSHRHIYGLLFRLLWPLCAGAPFSNRSYFFWEELAAASPEAGAVVVSSPTHLHHLGDDATRVHLKPNTLLFSSGGPLAQSAALHIEQIANHAPYEVYGSTETGGIAWRRRSETTPEPRWSPFPAIATRCSEQRLSIQSPFLSPPNTWYQTDDLVDLAENGDFHLRGRCDRLAKIGEKRVSLREIEQRLQSEPDLEAATCFILEGTRPQLVVAAALTESAFLRFLQEGPRQQHLHLKKALQEHLEPALLPKRGRYVRRLPQTSQGKTPQHLLAQLFAHDPFDPGRRQTMPTLVHYQERELGHHFEAMVPKDLIYLDGHFPQAAVVAGVVQLTWVTRLVHALTGLCPAAHQMEAVKFRNLLKPEDRFRIELRFDEARNKWRFQFKGEAGLISSGRLCI